MKFTIEQTVILKMLSRAGKLLPAKSQRKVAPPPREIVLKACGGWAFLEGPDSLAIGREALVLQDGSCVVDLDQILVLVRTYAGVPNLTFEAGDDYLQFRSTRINAHSQEANPSPPGHFRPIHINDTWLASAGAPPTTRSR